MRLVWSTKVPWRHVQRVWERPRAASHVPGRPLFAKAQVQQVDFAGIDHDVRL